jgi:hypothetical protein
MLMSRAAAAALRRLSYGLQVRERRQRAPLAVLTYIPYTGNVDLCTDL